MALSSSERSAISRELGRLGGELIAIGGQFAGDGVPPLIAFSATEKVKDGLEALIAKVAADIADQP